MSKITLEPLRNEKLPGFGSIHLMAVIGGSIDVGDKVTIPQGGGKPSSGVIKHILSPHAEPGNRKVLNSADENTVVWIVIEIGDRIWDPARRPTLTVVKPPPPTPTLHKDHVIKTIVLKYVISGAEVDSNYHREGDDYVALDSNSGGYPYRTTLENAERFKSLEKAISYAGDDLDKKYSPVEVTFIVTERLLNR